ncbi:MAG: thermonuclease family protein [Desulfovermiculus sp.]
MRTRAVCTGLAVVVLCLIHAWAGAEELTARVRWVVDGDTIILSTGHTVRLINIDAPELSRDDQPGQYYAQRSRQCAVELMSGVVVDVHAGDTDRFDRLLGTVKLADGTAVNKALVAKGAAFVCPWSPKEQAACNDLLPLQRRAMKDGVGFWGTILSLPEDRGPFVGNRRSKRFHTQECTFGQAIHAKNKQGFFTLRQAFQAGFAPGRCCSPWPERTGGQKVKGDKK